MSTRQRIARTLCARPISGAIRVAEPKFSTAWVTAAGVPVSDETLLGAALKILADQLVRGDLLESPTATRNYLALRFANLEHEVFCCLFLDNRHRLIACDELFPGDCRRGECPPAGSRQAGAVSQRGGRDPGPQPSVWSGRAEPG